VAPSDGPATFWDLLRRAARDRPDGVVLTDDRGGALTTSALAEQAELAAAGLLGHGLAPGDVLSWQLPTSLEAAVLTAACARLGVVQNPVIPLLRHREVGFILRQVGAATMITPTTWRGFDHAAMARSLGVNVIALDLTDRAGTAVRLPSGDVTRLPPPPAAGDECRWIYYSSGTTADPKGARHTDRSVMASSHGVVDGLGMRAGDRYPIAWPITHIGGIAMLTAALRTGGTLALFSSFDPVVTAGRMAELDPTILGSATPFFHAYLAAQRAHGDRPLYPRLRACVAGGAPTPPEVNRQVAALLGVRGIVGSWGLTEFPVATSETPDDPAVGTTVGHPMAGVRVRVVDGELRLRGPQCFLGYVDEALDAEAFDDGGWFRTGDLGFVDADGRVHVEGRRKDVIIRNAENISALEVENVLLRHPAIEDVAVVGVPDARTGERVCAVVVPRAGTEITLAELTVHCREQGLARYKCPERLELLDELPRSPMGKVVKRALLLALPGPAA
jgi:acyl-CoA synthetase (AMP-forming)/AMP-acid ligase II